METAGAMLTSVPNGVDTGDLSLVRRVQKGDKSAFDALVLKYQHKVLKLVQRYVRDPVEAEDVAQDAFIKAYRALPGFRGDSAFYTWLYRIAINTAKNALVSAGRRPLTFDLDGESNGPGAPAADRRDPRDGQPRDRRAARRPAHRHRVARARGAEL